MNMLTKQEALPTSFCQPTVLAIAGVAIGGATMVAGAVTGVIPVVVAGGVFCVGSLFLYSMATDNKTAVKISVGDLVRVELEREHCACASG